MAQRLSSLEKLEFLKLIISFFCKDEACVNCGTLNATTLMLLLVGGKKASCVYFQCIKCMLGGHTLITLACSGTYLVSKMDQNSNIVNRAYLVNTQTVIIYDQETGSEKIQGCVFSEGTSERFILAKFRLLLIQKSFKKCLHII